MRLLLTVPLFCVLSLYCPEIWSQTVTLTGSNDHVRVDKVGTVTFSGPGITLEEIAKKENLPHISGRTYRASIIYDIAFSKGLVSSRGKIFNCTDSEVNVNCTFYNGNSVIVTHKIVVKPRTFSRMLPDGFPISSIKNCNKIVCSEIGISVGKTRNSSQQSEQGYSKSTNAISNTNSKSYFNKATCFYGEDASNRLGVTYYPNGTCYLEGYVRYDGNWIKGTSEGRYYIKNCTLYVIWDDWINESYKLEHNEYKNDGVLFKLKK